MHTKRNGLNQYKYNNCSNSREIEAPCRKQRGSVSLFWFKTRLAGDRQIVAILTGNYCNDYKSHEIY